jgi:hypothetical protein
LTELEFVDPDPVSAKWLEAYRYWLSLGQTSAFCQKLSIRETLRTITPCSERE